jgi:transposase
MTFDCRKTAVWSEIRVNVACRPRLRRRLDQRACHEEGRVANIPPKSNRNDPICFSPYLYRARNQVERFFNKIKHCRRIATRYDGLAANYLAFVQLASIRLWLHANESTS